jgi:hypothetical protein
MKLKRLTPNGLKKFGEYLDLLEVDPASPVPNELLESADCSEAVGKSTDIAPPSFPTRFAIAENLDTLFNKAGFVPEEHDVGLWAWLTLAYFDILCPVGKTGLRNLGERARYIPEPQNFQRYYRHLLLGPYLIYRAHQDKPERAMALLCKPPYIIDDIVAQLAASLELVTNRSVMELATTLYYDSASKRIKRGAGGKGPGSPRRLVDILRQFDVTWDLYAMSLNELLDILPSEFDKFAKPKP